MLRLALLSVAFAAVPSAAAAQTVRHYWVDAQTGNDANAGTHAKPFKSVTKGVTAGQNDSVIHVRPGTYSPTKTGEKFTIVFRSPASNVKLLGADAATCILDFEQVKASQNSWYFLIDNGAKDIEIANLTMKNGAFRPVVPWFSSAIWWRGVDGLDLHHCVIESCESGIYSADGAKNVYVHDNVFWANNIPVRFRQDSTKGAKNCRFYNNFVANSTGGYADTISPSANDPTQVFVNNISMNNNKAGFQGGYPIGMVFENNLAFGNGTNYALARAVPKSNLTVDPQIVDYAKRNFRLKSTSPCIETGFAQAQPHMTNDFYGGGRVVDIDGNGRAVVDIGAHEAPGITLSVANWGQGKTARFSVAANVTQAGPSFFFLNVRTGSIVLDPFGSIALDVNGLLFIGSTSTPGTLPLPLPTNVTWTGQYAYFQAFAYNGKAFRASGRLDLEL